MNTAEAITEPETVADLIARVAAEEDYDSRTQGVHDLAHSVLKHARPEYDPDSDNGTLYTMTHDALNDALYSGDYDDNGNRDVSPEPFKALAVAIAKLFFRLKEGK
jgi:hypothetical protein